MPEVLDDRDCSCALLTRLRSDALLTLRDRARAQQPDEGGVGGSPVRPRQAKTGKASAEMLQELYLRAKVREAEEAKRKDEQAREEKALRRKLALLPPELVRRACVSGWDGMQKLIEDTLGDGSWARAISSVPDEWEEEEAIDAIVDLLNRPNESEHAWLLLEHD
jgi:hypothetical protein